MKIWLYSIDCKLAVLPDKIRMPAFHARSEQTRMHDYSVIAKDAGT